MDEEIRRFVIQSLEKGEDLPPELARFLFPPEKREYELVYYGKEREEDILANNLSVPLQPVRSFGKNVEGTWVNMLIFGDNLQVMGSLLEMKRSNKLCNADGTSGIRLVYIDPPFSSKQDFRGTDDQKAYQDKIAGAAFVEFIRKRLLLIKELLSSDGAIYVHLDWRKCHYLKTILDEIFGEANFQNELIWQRLSARSDSKTFNHIHDELYFYTSTQSFRFNKQYSEYNEEYIKKFYRYRDKDGRLYSLGDLTARGIRKGDSGKPWRGVDPAKLGNHWKVTTTQLEVLDKSGKIYWPPKGRVPRLKQYLDERQGRPLQSIWQDIPPVQFSSSENVGYPTQKPEKLLERIIKASSSPGDLVLDAFAGSGTTCAVAEKLGRRWIGIDCGKLAIYTIEKRMLNLRKDVGNNGAPLSPKPFVLYNAGLYDFSKLKDLPWEAWRFFALQLFQCRYERHRIGGVEFDGYLKGSSVLVYNHTKNPGAPITEETIEELHEAVGSRIGERLFIIAPALTFGFQQDYILSDKVRYYALRIPYSIINELHQHDFKALKQPVDEMDVNDTVEAVGFDFIRTPELKFRCKVRKRKGELFKEGVIQLQTFKSEAVVRDPYRDKKNLETLSLVMLDYNYDGRIFALDDIFYSDDLSKNDWEIRFPIDSVGERLMAVFIDIYGNEARRQLVPKDFRSGKAARANKTRAT